VVDLHCHVLPGVDDGPSTLEESLALCRAAYQDGTRTLVATPHVGWDYPEVTGPVIHAKVASLNDALRAAAIELTVLTGAEVALSRAGELEDGELDLLTLARGRYVLFEFPWVSRAAGAVHALRSLAHRGYGIVLAHPERSPMLKGDPALVRDLVDSGVLCCLDVASLTDRADRQTRSAAWGLLSGGLAHMVASDAHDAVQRSPRLRSTLADAGLSGAQIDYFTHEAPAAVLEGQAPAPPPRVNDRHHRRWLHLRGR
jgi:protein-tyrosine phosphatase